MKLQFDILCRLQVLEGMAGVTQGLWTDMGTPGMVRARRHFRDSGIAIDPLWFSNTDTDLYSRSHRVVSKVLGGSSREDADDVMQRVLSGISTTGNDLVLPFRQAGMSGAKWIRGGDTPARFSNRHLRTYLVHKAWDVVKIAHKFTPFNIAQHDGPTVPDEVPELASVLDTWVPSDWERMAEFLTADTGRRSHKCLLAWIATLSITGECISFAELARQMDLSKPTVGMQIRYSMEYWASHFPRADA